METNMRFKTPDPKFDIEVTSDGARLVNAATGEPIPADEPIFIMRAKDRRASATIANYAARCKDHDHVLAVEARVGEFDAFAAQHPDRMKEPDTAWTLPIEYGRYPSNSKMNKSQKVQTTSGQKLIAGITGSGMCTTQRSFLLGPEPERQFKGSALLEKLLKSMSR